HELQKISRETFDETFRDQNTPENMSTYLDQAFTEEKLISELSHPSSLFFFIRHGGHDAGYLKVNTGEAQTESMGHDALESERIYIRRAFKKLGLGKKLLDKAFEIAHSSDRDKIWRGVGAHNVNALDCYRWWGIVK